MKLITKVLCLIVIILGSTVVSRRKFKKIGKITDSCIVTHCNGVDGSRSELKKSGKSENAFHFCQIGKWHFHALQDKQNEILFKKNGDGETGNYYCLCQIENNQVSRSCVHREKQDQHFGCAPSEEALTAANYIIRYC